MFWGVSGCQKVSCQHSFVKLNSVNTESLSLHQLSYRMDECTVVVAEASLRSQQSSTALRLYLRVQRVDNVTKQRSFKPAAAGYLLSSNKRRMDTPNALLSSTAFTVVVVVSSSNQKNVKHFI